MLKKIIVTLLVFIVVISAAVPAGALESFSRTDVPGKEVETRLSREMYTAKKVINATTLNLNAPLVGITDIYCDDKGDIWVLCGNESRLVRVSADHSKGEEIIVTDETGAPIDYKGAKGIYYSKNDEIYISDTSNSRILIIDPTGKLIRTLDTPKSDLIPDDFIYQPVTIAIDDQGFTYILSLGCYYGALLYSPEGEFLGFYGANTSNATALDTLAFLWDKLTSNEAKKEASVKKLPYSFVDFDFDSEGYMVTCTGMVSNQYYISQLDNGTGQLKKISHNGANILYKRDLSGESTSSETINFLEKQLSFKKVQDIVAVTVSEDDYIFALDKTYGLIYIYDSECNLMASFGGGYGKGEQLGLFNSPISLALYNDNLYVADSENVSITVFEQTKYGKLLREAQNQYIKGDYSKAEESWQEVLKLNRNCQLAYRGLAMVEYNKGNYDKALDLASIAMDQSVYEMAWQQIINTFLADNFAWIALIILVLVGVIVFIVIKFKKQNRKFIQNKKLKLALGAPFHPFDSFRTLKNEKQFSIPIAVVITVLFYISAVLKVTASGFLYNTVLLKNYNSLYTLGSTVGLILLWSVSNWLVCTMFQGKGTFKEVYASTAYCLVPWIAYTFIQTILSNFLPLSCQGLLSGIQVAVLIYTIFLIAVAFIEIHEYDFFKVILTTIVIIFFMILVVFIILMCAILFKQFWTFIGSIYEEIIFR